MRNGGRVRARRTIATPLLGPPRIAAQPRNWAHESWRSSVLKDGYRPVFEGLVLGLWGGIAGRIILRSYMELEDATIVDPWMLFLTPIPLIAAAFWACYLPAAKAASVDPTVALRCD